MRQCVSLNRDNDDAADDSINRVAMAATTMGMEKLAMAMAVMMMMSIMAMVMMILMMVTDTHGHGHGREHGCHG